MSDKASSEISDGFADLVRDGGEPVLIHTAVCVLWKTEHENCKGCVSELGCGKTVGMLLVSMTPMMYKPTSYDDFEAMQVSMQDKMDRILKSKTVEEVTLVR